MTNPANSPGETGPVVEPDPVRLDSTTADALDGVTPEGVELHADRITNPATTEPARIPRFIDTPHRRGWSF